MSDSPFKDSFADKKASFRLLPAFLSTCGRWFYLLHAIIFLLFVYPYFEVAAEMQYPWILTCVNSMIILAIIYAIGANFTHLIFGCALGIPSLASYWIPFSPEVEIVSLASTILLYNYTLFILIGYLMSTKMVTSQQVFAAAAFYFLLSITWAHMHQMVEIIYPGSYYLADTHNLDGVLNWSDFLYFSITTITTLGYGDMAPISSQARSLSIMESITGVMCIGIMVSRMVGLSLQNESVKSSPHSDPIEITPQPRDISCNLEVKNNKDLPSPPILKSEEKNLSVNTD